ncbi:MAG: ATP-binding protein [Melioribacteraceae bacterium]|nr:ATP-binding protein [Melioribacteraceae bacterium]
MDNQKNSSLKHAVHDLNSLFTKVLNSLELLKNKLDKSDKNIFLLNSIETNIYLATEIVDELISKNKESKSSHLVNINSIVKEVVNSFPQLKSKKVKFILNLNPELKMIKGKYSDYFRLIMNLISNSYEAIENKGEISISTLNLDDNVFIEIIDNGIGIDENNFSQIFNDNFSTKNKDKFSGVGLSIVKNIVDKYNGKIDFNSKLNEGTTFKLYFKSENIVEKKSGLNKNILIAEDENILRELLTELFVSYDFNVKGTQDGKEFLDEISQNNYDVFIIDKNIPIVNGIECIKLIRNSGNKTPIILASGSLIDEEHEINSLVEKIILKPYNFDEILKAVNELV